MSRLEVWKRLFWKEFREGWPVVLVLFVAPVISARRGTVISGSGFIAIFGFALVVVVWAARKAARQNFTDEFARSHLPIGQLSELVPTFVAPMVTAGLAGAWFGYLWLVFHGWHKYLSEAMLLWAFVMTALFAAPYLLSRLFSQWPAVVVGMIGALYAWGAAGYTLSRLGDSEMAKYAAMAAQDSMHFSAIATLGSAVGAFALAALSRRTSWRTTQAAALGLALAIIVFPYAGRIKASLMPGRNYAAAVTWFAGSPDRSLSVGPVPGSSPDIMTELQYSDHRRNVSSSRSFKKMVMPIGISGRDTVYLAQQAPKERKIKIVAWKTDTNELRPVAAIPAKKNTLAKMTRNNWSSYYSIRSLSPDGRFALLDLQSLTGGQGTDLWLVDLRSGMSLVVLPNRSRESGVQTDWMNNEVAITGGRAGTRIDLKSLKTRDIKPPAPAGGMR